MKNEIIIRNIQSISKGQPINLPDEETDEFIDILLSHNCQYLIWKANLALNNKKAMLCNATLVRNKSIIKERYRLCEPLFNALEKNHIPYSIYKGAVLSDSAYGEPYYRKSFDIDLLLKKENIGEIKHILTGIGFIQGRIKDDVIIPYSRQELVFHSSMTHQTAPFIMQTGSAVCPFVNIDVNFDIMWGESDRASDMDFILKQTEPVQIYDINVRKLLPVMDFVAVCLHHYKDANSVYQLYSGKLNLCLYMDIYFYLKNNLDKITPDSLAAVCERLHISKYIYYCIYHANLIFGDKILIPYTNVLRTRENEFILEKFGLNEQEQRTWNWDFIDRLLDKDFHQKFAAMLGNEDIQKIQFNLKMMH